MHDRSDLSAVLDELGGPAGERPEERPAPGKVTRTMRLAGAVQRRRAGEALAALRGLPIQLERAAPGASPSPSPSPAAGEIRYELPVHTVTFGPPGPQVAQQLAAAVAAYAGLGIRVVHASAMVLPPPPPERPGGTGHLLDRAEDGHHAAGGHKVPRALDEGPPPSMSGDRQYPAQASEELLALLRRRAVPGQVSVYWIPTGSRGGPGWQPNGDTAATYDHDFRPNIHPDEEGIVIMPGAPADVLIHELGHLLMRIGHNDQSTPEERADPDVDDPTIDPGNVMARGGVRTGHDFTPEQLALLYRSRYLRPVARPGGGRGGPGPVQRSQAYGGAASGLDVGSVAEHGISGASGRLPYLDVIAGAFGHHDVSDVRVAVGGAAADASAALGAHAYATGDSIAFAREPDLHLAAHEAAHVVQQRAGVQLADGLGAADDEYERHADAVADAVVRGESAEALLDHRGGGGGGVQRAAVQRRVRQEDAAAVRTYERLLADAVPAEARLLRAELARAVDGINSVMVVRVELRFRHRGEDYTLLLPVADARRLHGGGEQRGGEQRGGEREPAPRESGGRAAPRRQGQVTFEFPDRSLGQTRLGYVDVTAKLGGSVSVTFSRQDGGSGGGGGGGADAGGGGTTVTDNVTVDDEGGLGYERQVETEINRRVGGYTPTVTGDLAISGDEASLGVGGHLRGPEGTYGLQSVGVNFDLVNWDRESRRGINFLVARPYADVGFPPFQMDLGGGRRCQVAPTLKVELRIQPSWERIVARLVQQAATRAAVAGAGGVGGVTAGEAALAGAGGAAGGVAIAAVLGVATAAAVAAMVIAELENAREVNQLGAQATRSLYRYCISYTATFFRAGGYSGRDGQSGRAAAQAAMRQIAEQQNLTLDQVVEQAGRLGARAIYREVFQAAMPRFRDQAAERVGSVVRFADDIQGQLMRAQWGHDVFNREGGAHGLPTHGHVPDREVPPGSSQPVQRSAVQRSPAGRPVVQRNRERDRIERAQSWDQEVAGPLDGEQAASFGDDAAAIRANVDLRLTDDKVRRLRAALGLVTRGRTGAPIDRALVRALRDRQGGGGPGVLDESTVFAIDLGQGWPGLDGAPAHYRTTAPWSALDEARLRAIRAAVVPALRVAGDDLTLSPPRRGVAHAQVTPTFVQHAVNWQFWARRSEAAVSWGRLTAGDLQRLGVTVEAPPAEAQAGAEVEAGEAPAPALSAEEEAAEAADSEATATDVDEDGADTATGFNEADQAFLRDLIRELRPFTRGTQPPTVAATIDSVRARAMEKGVDNERIRTAPGLQRLHLRAQRVRDGIREALGQLPPLAERAPRPGAASEPAGTTPDVERRSVPEARAHLEEARVGVDRDEEGRMESRTLRRGEGGWEGRVLRGGRAGTVATMRDVSNAADQAIDVLEDLKRRMHGWEQRLQAVDGTPEQIPQVLQALAAELARDPFPVPVTLRRPWRPNLPREITDAQLEPGRARQTERQWRNALRTAVADATRQIALHRRYRDESSLRENPDAVRVDLSRSGVRVTNNHGRQLGPDEMHLDVRFADAMLRFLQYVGGLGATEMWTAGFLRNPISPDDTHPRGQACDITGFVFGGTRIHLNSGRRDPAGYPEGGERGRFSDWYNHTDRLGDQTFSQILHALTARMARHFSSITGPGHDAAHAGHWHVELADGRRRGPRVHAIQDAPPEIAVPDSEAGGEPPAA